MNATSIVREAAVSDEPGQRPLSPARFHCITPVWGAKYVARFVDMALPSLLAAGNLPSLPAGKCFYQVFTRSVDVPALLAAPSFRRLKELVSVSIELIDDVPLENPLLAMTLCHRRALQGATEADAAYMFLLPDHVWSDGSFVKMQQLLESGKRAVMVAGIRVRAETAEPRFRREFVRGPDQSLSIAPRSLVELMLSCFHPHTTAQLADADGNLAVSRYYWDVNGHGMIARCCDLLPMVVWPAVTNAPIATVLDHEYVRLSCPVYTDLHVVTDSDEICAIEVSDSLHRSLNEISFRIIDTRDVVLWMNEWTNSYHRAYFQTAILFHAKDIGGCSRAFASEWSPILEQSNELVRKLMAAFHEFHSDLPDHGESLVGTQLHGRTEPEAPSAPAPTVVSPPETATAEPGSPVSSTADCALRVAAAMPEPLAGSPTPAPQFLPRSMTSAPANSPVLEPCANSTEIPVRIAAIPEPEPLVESPEAAGLVTDPAPLDSVSSASIGREGMRLLQRVRKIAVTVYQLINGPLCRRIAQLEHRLIQVEGGLPHTAQAQAQFAQNCTRLEQRVAQLEQARVQFEQENAQLHGRVAQLDRAREFLEQSRARLESGVSHLEHSRAHLERDGAELEQRVARLEQNVPYGNGYKAWMLNSYRESLNRSLAVRRILDRTAEELRQDVATLRQQLSAIDERLDGNVAGAENAGESAVAGAIVPGLRTNEASKQAA